MKAPCNNTAYFQQQHYSKYESINDLINLLKSVLLFFVFSFSHCAVWVSILNLIV